MILIATLDLCRLARLQAREEEKKTTTTAATASLGASDAAKVAPLIAFEVQFCQNTESSSIKNSGQRYKKKHDVGVGVVFKLLNLNREPHLASRLEPRA